MSQAYVDVLFEDDGVRITRWTFPTRGFTTGKHKHEFDYVVVPITNGSFIVSEIDGSTTDMTQIARKPYYRSAGAEHSVTNNGPERAEFVEIECK